MQHQWAFSNYLHRGINAIGYQTITTRTIQVYNKRTLTNTWIPNVDRNLNKPKGKRSLLRYYFLLERHTHIAFIAVIITQLPRTTTWKNDVACHTNVTIFREKKSINERQLWLGYYYWKEHTKYYEFTLISKINLNTRI